MKGRIIMIKFGKAFEEIRIEEKNKKAVTEQDMELSLDDLDIVAGGGGTQTAREYIDSLKKKYKL